MEEALINMGFAGALLLVVFLLGKLTVSRVAVPLMEAHVASLKSWERQTERIGNDTAVLVQVMSNIQKTQVEIHASVAAQARQLEEHVAKRQEYDTRVLKVLDELANRARAG